MAGLPHDSDFNELALRENFRLAAKRIDELQTLIDTITVTPGGTPTGAAGGVLDGTYPNPGLAASVAGNGLTESSDVLAVNVDDSTIEVATDVVQVKDGGITAAKVAADVATQAELDAAASTAATNLAAHGADTTNVHGIADTSVLATDTDVSTAITTHDESLTAHEGRLPRKVFPAPNALFAYCASPTNLGLSGLGTVDGETVLDGYDYLALNQTDPAENGMWRAAAGAWTRTPGFDTDEGIHAAVIRIVTGATYLGQRWACMNVEVPTIDTDPILFERIDSNPPPIAVDLPGLYGSPIFEGTWTLDALNTQYMNSLSLFLHQLSDYAGTDGISVDGYTNVIAGYQAGAVGLLELQGAPIYLNGGVQYKSATKTTNYTMTAADCIVAYTALAAARTVTLPSLSAVAAGQVFRILDATTGTHASTNNITVQRAGSDLFVGGGTNTVISTANGYVDVMKINNRWMVVNAG